MRMGNTPTHQSHEGDTSDGDDTSPPRSLRARVAAVARSFVDGVRRRLSVFSGLDFGQAFRIEEETFAPDTRLPPAESDETTDPTPLPEVATTAEKPLPKRDRPLTPPVHDREIENGPDLESTEEDGQLSIYYPDHEDATITSDTWERIER